MPPSPPPPKPPAKTQPWASHPSLAKAALRIPTLDSASLARHGGPILAELLAADPSSFLPDATTLGAVMRRNLSTSLDTYLNLLALHTPRFSYDEYVATTLVCRLCVASLILSPSSGLYSAPPSTGGVQGATL